MKSKIDFIFSFPLLYFFPFFKGNSLLGVAGLCHRIFPKIYLEDMLWLKIQGLLPAAGRNYYAIHRRISKFWKLFVM